jgi:penicillin-binding protein 2
MRRRAAALLALAACAFPALAADPPVSRVAPPGSLPQPEAAPPAQAPAGGSVRQLAPVGPQDSPLKPTWETQSLARALVLSIPAPRGQITDRWGQPLAQTRISQSLALQFPAGARWTPEQAVAFARERLARASALLGRTLRPSDAFVAAHFKNRAALPMDVASDLRPEEAEKIQRLGGSDFLLRPVYVRFYPNGPLAGHLVGYAGRAGRPLDSPIELNDPLFPESQGREGIEQAFNGQLTGKPGQMNVTVDPEGRRVSEKVLFPPQPGNNVVTSLDLRLQRICEETLAKRVRRGAIVIIDPNYGDVLAMASWPCFNPNDFVPSIAPERFQAYQDDPSVPLLPRAYRSAYPPGSTFKTFVGLAALESQTITPTSEFNCPTSFSLGKLVFRNWKKSDAGSLDFAGALTQSCNTWFYQVGVKMGGATLSDWAIRCGFGERTGLPLASETAGRIPTDDYMTRTYGRKLLSGDAANLSIGQGDTLISPLQMAVGMALVANGGTVIVPRLVLQVQTHENRVVAGYEPRARGFVTLRDSTRKSLRKGLLGVVESSLGTAGQAAVPKVRLAGKTGTAQWGPKQKERTAAWFAGYAPADEPRYAFAAVYEGEPGDDDVHGGTHAAPLIGKVMREVFKLEDEAKKQEAAAAKKSKEAEEAAARDEALEAERLKEIERQAKDDN